MAWEKDFSRGYHVDDLKYFYAQEHAMVGIQDTGDPYLGNIGEQGQNLTFAVLSMNRASLMIRLMDSVAEFCKGFRGEFLVGDNGSNKKEKELIRQAMKRMPYKCRMIEFDRNYGVAGGRNKLFAEVNTDWIFSVDNDLYLVGDPLSKIQQDISVLGCHFMTLPLVDHDTGGTGIFGGHLYIDNTGRVSIGGSTALIAPTVTLNCEYPPFLATFLAGGVSVLNKHTFFACGGFDAGMFVGFEDTEFSVRLYQKGYKVACCGIACIIHNHPKPEKTSDVDYEKKRFSRNHIKEAASYFEKKHGFAVWNPSVDRWLEDKHASLFGAPKQSDRAHKPKIALVIDAHDWALDHVASQIVENLSDTYDFRKIYISFVDNLAQILLLAEDCKLIHFLWRPLASSFYDVYTQHQITRLGFTSEEFKARFVDSKHISVAVYDHLMLGNSADNEFTYKLFSSPESIVDSYTVSNKKLLKQYNEDQSILKKPAAITQDGVDLELFRPLNIKRLASVEGRTIKIGWVGNSKWQVGDLKGINTIIKPAIEILQMKGHQVELITSDRQQKLIPHHKMPEFYADLDLYICASSCEGTPNPVLEAMACGLPIISTDVGLVPEVFGDLQKQFILEERTVQCLCQKMERMLQEPTFFAALSSENLDSIKAWHWRELCHNFRNYFDDCLRNGKTYGVLKNEQQSL